jgi:hypothetical protein
VVVMVWVTVWRLRKSMVYTSIIMQSLISRAL